jgi:hypothetical protein
VSAGGSRIYAASDDGKIFAYDQFGVGIGHTTLHRRRAAFELRMDSTRGRHWTNGSTDR